MLYTDFPGRVNKSLKLSKEFCSLELCQTNLFPAPRIPALGKTLPTRGITRAVDGQSSVIQDVKHVGKGRKVRQGGGGEET